MQSQIKSRRKVHYERGHRHTHTETKWQQEQKEQQVGDSAGCLHIEQRTESAVDEMMEEKGGREEEGESGSARWEKERRRRRESMGERRGKRKDAADADVDAFFCHTLYSSCDGCGGGGGRGRAGSADAVDAADVHRHRKLGE